MLDRKHTLYKGLYNHSQTDKQGSWGQAEEQWTRRAAEDKQEADQREQNQERRQNREQGQEQG